MNNIITDSEINTRSELWEDYIYHINFDYPKIWPFPRHDKTGDFIPLPIRFGELIGFFHDAFAEQKKNEELPEKARELVINAHKDIIQELIKEKTNDKELSELGGEVESLLNTIENHEIPLNICYRQIRKFIDKWKDNQVQPETIEDERNWKDISIHFTPALILEWRIKGFDFLHTKAWFDVLSPSRHEWLTEESDFIEFLVKTKGDDCANPEWWLNYSGETEMGDVYEEFKKIKERKTHDTINLDEIENKLMSNARVNACFVKEDNNEYIRFVYQPPKGNFQALSNFLWYRNNTFYETLQSGGWKRINHENAEVRAVKCTFIHTFPHFANQGGQGILTYHPNIGKRRNEQSFVFPNKDGILSSNEIIDLASDWQPSYS
jgi:hypothetical protein